MGVSMSTGTARFLIDGKWVTATSAGDYGCLGQRYLCDFVAAEGKQPKKMLLRLQEWHQAGAAPAPLALETLENSKNSNIRAAKLKSYQRSAVQADGKAGAVPCPVWQQEVTGLVPLKNAILGIVKKGEPRPIGRLFFACCHALDRFGRSYAADRPVPLQCPSSLAVGANFRIALLDAEMRLPGVLNSAPEARQLFGTWFGDGCANGCAEADKVSSLHAAALLQYFRQVFAIAQQQATPEAAAAIAAVAAQLSLLEPGMSLEEMQAWIRKNRDDWSLPVEEEAAGSGFDVVHQEPAPGGSPFIAAPPVIAPPPRPARRSLLLRLSLWLNLLLVIGVVVLWLLWTRAGAGSKGTDRANEHDGAEHPAAAAGGQGARSHSAVLHSSYCVVFPTQGTISDKVNASLSELFPGQVTEAAPRADGPGAPARQKAGGRDQGAPGP